MIDFFSACSLSAPLSRRSYWGHVLGATLGFVVLFHAYLLCLMAQASSLPLSGYQVLLVGVLLLAAALAIPAGPLALLPFLSLASYADPSCFPKVEAQHAWLCGGAMLLATFGMLALVLYGLALAARRLRSAGFSPWLLLLGLLPGACLLLAGLYCFPTRRVRQ